MDILLFALILFNIFAGTALVLIKVERKDRRQAQRAKAARDQLDRLDKSHFR